MSKYSQRLQKAQRAKNCRSQSIDLSYLSGPHSQNATLPRHAATTAGSSDKNKLPKSSRHVQHSLASALEAQRSGRLADARSLYETILTEQPDHANALHLLGVVHRDLGDLATAAELIERAISIEPRAAIFLTNLAIVESKRGQLEKASAAADKAAELQPNDVITLLLAGLMHCENDRHELGRQYYRRVLELDPNNLIALTSFASQYERDAKFEEAQAIVDQHLPRVPEHLPLTIVAARLQRRAGRFAEAIRILERAGQTNAQLETSSSAQFELGRIHDAAGEHDRAFNATLKANDLQRSENPNTSVRSNEALHHLSTFKSVFTREWAQSWSPVSPYPAEQSPIFVFGFPRSGNTLLEQILKSHSRLQTLMEKPMLHHMTHVIDQEMGGHPHAFRQLSGDQLERLRDEYFSVVNQFLDRDPQKRIVDAHPMNTHNAALMHRLFPAAKLTLVIRHPYDVCLSCLFQNFRNPLVRQNTNSLEEIAEWYVQTMDLWQQFCDTLSLQHHLIRYEDLVERFDEEVQALCQYLDIPWQEEMRNFNVRAAKQGGITTASYHQVTEGLYRHARYRWRNYSKQLAAIIPRLRPYAERFGYPTG